jgi:hypothetical protein
VRLFLTAGVAVLACATPASAHYYAGCKKGPCKRHVAKPYSGWLAKVGGCETRGYSLRGSLRAHNPSGLYHGRYQFDLQSWRGAGGWGDPHQHTRTEQNYRAVVWLHRAGRGAWPHCG